MIQLSLPPWEFVIRAVVVYLFLLLALRATGKRQIGQLAPFDLVLILVLSNSVQNSMNGGDNSLIGGLISAFALVILNLSVSWATFRWKSVENWIEGKPEVLIHNGKLYAEVLNRERVTRHELEGALRRAGCLSIEEVRIAMIETNGEITVIQKKNHTGYTEK